MSGIKKILVPTDFSEASKESLRYACTLADALHASLHIIHVSHDPYLPGGFLEVYVPPPDYFKNIEREASRELGALLSEEETAKYQAQAGLPHRSNAGRDPGVSARAGGHRPRGDGDARARWRCAADDGKRSRQRSCARRRAPS